MSRRLLFCFFCGLLALALSSLGCRPGDRQVAGASVQHVQPHGPHLGPRRAMASYPTPGKALWMLLRARAATGATELLRAEALWDDEGADDEAGDDGPLAPPVDDDGPEAPSVPVRSAAYTPVRPPPAPVSLRPYASARLGPAPGHARGPERPPRA